MARPGRVKPHKGGMLPFLLFRPATAADGFVSRCKHGPDSPQSGWPRCTRRDAGKMNEPATIEHIGWPTQLLSDFRLIVGFCFVGPIRGGLFADFRGVGGFGNS